MPAPALKRVAQVVRPAQGGIRRHVSLLIGGLDPSRFSSTLFAPNDFSLEDPSSSIPQISIEISARSSVSRDYKAISTLRSLLLDRFDVVHSHGLRAALIGVIAARRASIPALYTAHNLPPTLNAVQRFALLLVSRRSNAIITVSESVSIGLQEYGVDGSRIRVIPNGIPLDQYVIAPANDIKLSCPVKTGNVVAFVGRLSPEKGVDTLLDAFTLASARRPGIRLIVIGSGPDEVRLRLKAAGQTGVDFVGYRTDIPVLLAGADLLVSPSYSEGQGIAAIEAMASGLPVIASKVGGLAETVIDGVTGILVPPNDALALSDAIISVLEDPLKASRMGEAGKQRAMAEYSVTRMIEAVETLYLAIINDLQAKGGR